MKKQRASPEVAVLVARLGPYHVAKLAALGGLFGAERVVAVEIATGTREYGWDPVGHSGFVRQTLFAGREYESVGTREMRAAVVRALDGFDPAAVAVNGWGWKESRAAVSWCRARDRTAIVMSDSQERDRRRSRVKETIKRMVLSGCDAALVAGERHAEYLERLGFDRRRVALGYDVVDNDHFARGAAVGEDRAAGLRRDLGVPERYLLCSARFVPQKNLDSLLRAYVAYRRNVGNPWDLVLLGDGPLRGSLLRLRSRVGLDGCVHFAGFKQYAELPDYYALAKALILPSTSEPWGLVVNEAMAAGLPVLVSQECGAAELVREGLNGYTFDPFSVRAISRALEVLHEDEPRLRRMGLASAEIVAGLSPATFATELARAIRLGDEHRRARPRRLLPNVALWF